MFNEVLREIMRRTEGCLGALIMGTDGIAVQKVWQAGAAGEASFDAAVAEFVTLIKNVRHVNSEMGLGTLREVTFTGESGIFILRFVNRDYFIALILSPEGNFGRGRYELNRAGLLLEKELAF